MFQNKKQKDRFSRFYNDVTEDNFKTTVSRRISKRRIKLNTLEIKETESGFHYALKIPGYIKEDFRFYVSDNDLVVTTEKSGVKKGKHSYCYPSAYFKRRFPLPYSVKRDEIKVDYIDEVLHFDLYK